MDGSQGLSLRRLDSRAPEFRRELDALVAFEIAQDPAVDATVAAIIADVRARGDAALLECTARFDGVRAATVGELEIGRDALRHALDALPAAERDALAAAAARIRVFHERQKAPDWSIREPDGTELGQRVTPLDRVGIYVPGGKAAYPSSVLMNAIPAQVAGVREVVMVVPTPGGVRNPLVLAAACLSGVTRVFAIGGAQAIAALAYGTQTIPAVDKICGPGNAYVAAAKRRVFGAVLSQGLLEPCGIVAKGGGLFFAHQDPAQPEEREGHRRVEVRPRLLAPGRVDQRNRSQAHRQPHEGAAEQRVRERLGRQRGRMVEKDSENTGRHHEEAEAGRLDHVLGPVTGQRLTHGGAAAGSGRAGAASGRSSPPLRTGWPAPGCARAGPRTPPGGGGV